MRITVEQHVFGYRVRLTSDDQDEFFQALESLKAEIPRSLRRYNPEGRYWHVERRAKARLEHWLIEMQLDYRADVVWAEEEQPSNARGRESGRWERRTRPETCSIEEAYRALHLLPGAPMKLVEAARRILLVEAHPDKGGDHEQAVAINNAFDLIKTTEGEKRRGVA